jgi:hypothetical protein
MTTTTTDWQPHPMVGKRVRLLAPMVNPNSKWMPVEKGMPVGLEGTIVWVSIDGPYDAWRHYGVRWDNGRSLNLQLRDTFEILEPKEAEV